MLKRLLCLLLALGAAFALCACTPFGQDPASSSGGVSPAQPDISEPVSQGSESASPGAPVSGELKVHFIDVAQGDSAFVELPGGECMLIDCGERDYVGRVISLADCLGYRRIDYILVTHPHTDHMGGMSAVIGSFDIGRIFMPDCVATNSAFTALLDAVSAKGLKIEIARAGVCIFDKTNLRADLLGPVTLDSESFNNCSAVLKLRYGNTSFLFAGDAEKEEERELISACGEALESDVVKIGHHGSADSSSEEFVSAVGAKIGVISCGADNPYGHPDRTVMSRWIDGGTEVLLRTDLEGTVLAVSDGETVSAAAENTAFDHKWVLNIGGKKIHDPSCEGAKNIQERNRAYSVRTLAELEAQGYEPCGTCKPKE